MIKNIIVPIKMFNHSILVHYRVLLQIWNNKKNIAFQDDFEDYEEDFEDDIEEETPKVKQPIQSEVPQRKPQSDEIKKSVGLK